jgi:mannose-6-phosphate isomerase-like protein (cupin superfamily)
MKSAVGGWLLVMLLGSGVALAAAPYHANVAQLARDNDLYRRVLFTGDQSQLVLMSIPPGEDIGQETHRHVEQTIVCVSGSGRLSLGGVESSFGPGDVVVITPGTQHDVRNIGTAPLKLYTIYVPPNHIDGRVQATRAAAEADHEDEAFGRRVE